MPSLRQYGASIAAVGLAELLCQVARRYRFDAGPVTIAFVYVGVIPTEQLKVMRCRMAENSTLRKRLHPRYRLPRHTKLVSRLMRFRSLGDDEARIRLFRPLTLTRERNVFTRQ
jgi:hypothetical protein